jgi:hypothetical protein
MGTGGFDQLTQKLGPVGWSYLLQSIGALVKLQSHSSEITLVSRSIAYDK